MTWVCQDSQLLFFTSPRTLSDLSHLVMLVHKLPVRGPGKLGFEVPSYPKPAQHCRNLGTPILKHLTQCHQQFEWSLKLMSTQVPVINASISYHSQQQIPRGLGLPSWWVISGTAYTLWGQPQGTCVHTHLLGALAFLPHQACPGPILLSERRVGRGAPRALHSYSHPTPSFPFTATTAPWGIQGSSLSCILRHWHQWAKAPRWPASLLFVRFPDLFSVPPTH